METTNIDTQLKPIEKEVLSFRKKAESIVIKNDDDYNEVSNFAGSISAKEKDIDKLRKFFTEPLNAQLDNINAMFMPQIKEAKSIVVLLKGKMSVYFTEKEEARLKEEKRKQDIRDKANAKRAEQGKEEIAEPIKDVAPVNKTVTTDSVQTQIRKVWKHEVKSMSKLPDDVKKAIFEEAWKKGIVDMVIKKFVDAGIRSMTGVDIFEENTVALKRVK